MTKRDDSVISKSHGRSATRITPTSEVQLDIKTGEIYTCVFSPDDSCALIGSQRNPVGLWDLTTGRLMRTYEHTGSVWALAWSSDGKSFLSLDGRMWLWDVNTGECLKEFDGHHFRCVDWSDDQILSASHETLQLTDQQSGRTLRRLEGHTDWIYCADFDNKKDRALSGSRDTTIRVWDLQSGRCTGVLEGHTYHVHGVAWSPDQKQAVSCSQDIRVWDIQRGSCLQVLSGHTQTIRTVQWSADQKRLISAAHDRTVRLWNAETGECLSVFKGHGAGVVAATFTQDQRSAISCDWKGGIRTWDLTKLAV